LNWQGVWNWGRCGADGVIGGESKIKIKSKKKKKRRRRGGTRFIGVKISGVFKMGFLLRHRWWSAGILRA